MCFSFCICSLVSIAIDPYSYELTSCGIDFNGYRTCFDAYFIPLAFLYKLSLPPLRFAGSSSSILVLDGLAPSVCPLSSSSFEDFGFRVRIKGSY
jgi:hypothetical protein